MNSLCLSLTVEGIAGSTFEECARDILILSKQLNLCVDMKCNGTMMFAWPHDTEDKILKRFRLMQK